MARPCGRADLAPEAMIVGKDISSAPARRAANSISAATSTSFTPGRKTSIAPDQRDLPLSYGSPGPLQFFLILHHAGPFDD